MTEQPEQEQPKPHGRKQQWDSVGPGLERFPVPGGWIYKTTGKDVHGASLPPAICFVPDAEAAKQDRPPGEAREVRLSGI